MITPIVFQEIVFKIRIKNLDKCYDCFYENIIILIDIIRMRVRARYRYMNVEF